MILRRIFSSFQRKPEAFIETPPARIFRAIQLMVPDTVGKMAERFPWSREASFDDRILFFATAFVYVVGLDLNGLEVTPERRSALRQELLQLFKDWQPEGLKFIEDCHEFVQSEQSRLTARGIEFARPQFEQAFGFWTLTNCASRPITLDAEASAAGMVGGYITRMLEGCWQITAHEQSM